MDFYKSYSKVFSSSFKLLLFLLKIFKKFTSSVLLSFWKIYRFGLFSKGFYCLLFNVLFCSALQNDLHYTIPFFVCQYFSTIFSKIFFHLIFRQNKKLVMLLLFYSLSISFITNSYVYFFIFVCCKVLLYISIFLS